jgi:hypothetical protein
MPTASARSMESRKRPTYSAHPVKFDPLGAHRAANDNAPSCAELCGLEAEYRRGLPQWNIVRVYLNRAQAAGAEVETSFLRVLSDFISQCRGGGGAPDTENYVRAYLSRRGRS